MPTLKLTYETQTCLHDLLTGKPFEQVQYPNGSSTDEERALVDAIAPLEISERLKIYHQLTHRYSNKPEIDALVFAPKPPTPPAPVIEYVGKEKESRFKSADYVKLLGDLGFSFRLCELDDMVEVNGEPLSDVMVSVINSRVRNYGVNHVNVMKDAYIAHAKEQEYNPIRDYLDGLKWNGTDWITTLSVYLIDEYDLLPILLKRWLVGAVARVYQYAQNRLLLLDSKQNLGKSTFASWLGSPLAKYYQEGGINPDDKDHILRLSNTWIWEVSEMGSTMRRADVEALKSFLTLREVKVRQPYGRYPVRKRAITSFIGTVNNIGGVLNDPSGSRRYMATKLVSIDFEYTRLDVNQVWAQAVELYRAGEPWQPLPAELERINEINSTYEVENPVEDLLYKLFLVDPANLDWFTPTLRIIEILHNAGWKGSTPQSDAMIVATATKRIGLRRLQTVNSLGDVQRGYVGIREKLISRSAE